MNPKRASRYERSVEKEGEGSQERSRSKFVDTLLKAFRMRMEQSKEKTRLKNELKIERSRLRKIKRVEKRRRNLGSTIIRESIDSEK